MAHVHRRIATLFFAISLLAAAGCAEDEKRRPPVALPGDAATNCVDQDNDSYYAVSPDCPGGDDCDDTNADVTSQCRTCLDDPISEGCGCEPQMGVECVPPPKAHPEGLLVCREGTRYCRDGFWTECEPLGEYVLVRN
jgi:hypothetical protein